MRPILTVTIPVYNMERYLDRCLSSVTIPEAQGKLEIIIVDDGSTDNSRQIIDLYVNKYPSLFRAIYKMNGGWGSCIKLGIKEARGKYFKILDSDDWFENKNCLDFLAELQDLEADAVLSPFREITNTGEIKVSYPSVNSGATCSISQALLAVEQTIKGLHLASLTYKTCLLNNAKIDIGDRYYSDINYDLQPMAFVKTLFFSPYEIYQYDKTRLGQSTSEAGYINHIDDYIELLHRQLVFYNETKDSMEKSVKEYFFNLTMNQCRFIYKLFLDPKKYGRYEKMDKLRLFDKFLKNTNKKMYYKLGRACIRKVVPFVFLWRYFGINVFLFR